MLVENMSSAADSTLAKFAISRAMRDNIEVETVAESSNFSMLSKT